LYGTAGGDSQDLEDLVKEEDFIGFLHIDNRTLPEGKVKYHIDYELLNDK
jgi:hypothetical protein